MAFFKAHQNEKKKNTSVMHGINYYRLHNYKQRLYKYWYMVDGLDTFIKDVTIMETTKSFMFVDITQNT